MKITAFHPRARDLVGFIPTFLDEADERPVAEQFNERYAFGGGWSPMDGWALMRRRVTDERGVTISKRLVIQYPGDPAYEPVALIEFRDEKVWIYRHAWVAIENAKGVEVARMD